MKKYIFLTICFSFLFTSCSVLNKSTNAAFFEAQAKIDPIEAEVIVDDSKKIRGSSKSTYLLGFLRIAGDNKYESQNVILFIEKNIKTDIDTKTDRHKGFWNIFDKNDKHIFKTRYNDFPWK